jgi:hypothetical protein
MDLEKVLTQLREELASLDAAILSLERLQEMSGSTRRRRKPRAPQEAPTAAPSGDENE